jgi:alpha-tubulin suppressor-like RCC1 family protein
VGPTGTWTAIASADDRSCGIHEGELYCWGNNQLGFLGDGTMNPAPAPVRIGTASDWTEIALGASDACGVRAGKLYCWGRNDSGLVGTGDKTAVYEPAQIGTAGNWSGLTMGMPACGLRDGALYCWGPRGIFNSDPDPLVPTRVGTDSDWTAIRTYDAATCGLRHGGELYCWGADFIGQLPGATKPADRNDTPVSIGTLTWDDIEVQYDYFCGLSSGSLYCWGDNEDGKLGLGTIGTIEPLRVVAGP